uniref:Uncharacterized protein n=1 Tax=uncultured prokaryote TaxID=198431 RepID=A0A0H5Q400_9ZZZZ|nr:hypothetical protein [uncultured prokaryote]
MTDYRVVVRHVRYWRGAIHRWSTVYPLTGSLASSNYPGVIAATYTMEQAVNFKAGNVGGGVYEIALYDHATGGVPVSVQPYFNYESYPAWIGYTSTGWGAATEVLESAAEVALQVEWAAGLSSSGKPVRFRKWFHSVPATVSITIPPVDVSPARITSLTAAFTTWSAAVGGLGVPMGNSSRLAANTPVIAQDFGNHQMPRGRRRKRLTLETPSGKISLSDFLQLTGE